MTSINMKQRRPLMRLPSSGPGPSTAPLFEGHEPGALSVASRTTDQDQAPEQHQATRHPRPGRSSSNYSRNYHDARKRTDVDPE